MSAGSLRAAAHLALGGLPGGGAPPVAAREVLELLTASKVPLVSLAAEWDDRADPLWTALRAAPELADALARETSDKVALHAAWIRVEAAFRDEGIRTVLFKSPGPFPYRSSNLDVLVEPRDFQRGARLLEEGGHLRLAHYREDHKLLYRTFPGGAPGLSVHLHEAVSWGKAIVLDGAGVVGRSIAGEEEGVRIASRRDGLAAALAHSILETDQIRLADLRLARRALAAGVRAVDLLEEAGRMRWHGACAAALVLYDGACRVAGGGDLLPAADREAAGRALAEHPWAAAATARILASEVTAFPLRLPRLHAKRHFLRLVLEDDRRDPGRKVVDLASTAWNLAATRLRLRSRPAALVTFSGPDGSGKSAAADSVVAALTLCEIPVRRVWMRGGFSRAGVAAKALARAAVPGLAPPPADEAAKRRFLEGRLRRIAWSWAVALEQAAALQAIRWHLAMGRSVVCDRYAWDSIADLAARLGGGAGAAAKSRAASFLLGAAPEPGAAIRIVVSPEVAHARKDDGGSLASRRDLSLAFDEIAASCGLTPLDGSVPLPELREAAVATALRAVLGRFRGGRA